MFSNKNCTLTEYDELYKIFMFDFTADPIGIVDKSQRFRIVNGDPAKIEDHPYEVIIEIKYIELFCAGAIISDRHIVTVARCARFAQVKRAIIRSGSSRKNFGGDEHNISLVTIHQDWEGDEENNIAVVKVVEPFQFNKIPKAIPLMDQDEKIQNGTSAIVSGWGVTESGETNQLFKLSVVIIDLSTCKKMWKVDHIDEGWMCAKNFENKGKVVCSGDYGDTLVIGKGQDKRLAGILIWTWRLENCDDDKPRAYVNIAHYRNWINEAIQK
ncbi:hypothetical protein QAD02_023575 [Eretmocerus hayati]|uniref:Uncharacterized protein n=1 Tax=Eretmocerus hayati TaxID=131215 RepID=A0ACC2PXX0_9HYME|nr:hypothetical protein QAD02_023575 [Eretmocerus hayati]